MEAIIQFVLAFGAKYPVALSIFAVIGVLRAVFKPLMMFLDAVAVATPSSWDNDQLAALKASKVYQSIAAVVDYLASIKLPGYDR